MKKKIFIDGEEGTTGLQLSEKLKNHSKIDLKVLENIEEEDILFPDINIYDWRK